MRAGRDDDSMRRVATFVVLVVATVGVRAAPAAAHGVAGAQPTNYETRIGRAEPPVAGIELRSVELGDQLELRNATATEVLVLGYHDEPYLRVGPDGVFENRSSPSWAANRTSDAEVTTDEASDERRPEWVKVGSGDTVRWHDHRAHWMGNDDPTAVREHPGREHQVLEFDVLLRQNGREITFTGEVVWVPGPSPWPWIAIASVLALGLALASRGRVWTFVIGGALVVLVAAEAIHVAGTWGATTSATSTKLAASAYSLAGIAIGVGALVWLVRSRDPYDATPSVLVAGLFLAVAGGFADLTTLTRSQVPTTLGPVVARSTVAVAIGLGVGLATAAGMRIRRPVASAGTSPPVLGG